MTRVVVAADSGPALARLTAAVGTVPGAYIVRHGSSAGPLDRIVGPLGPDLVVIGSLLVPEDGLARLAEIERVAPDAKVVVLSSTVDATWLADALRAHAAAVVPGEIEPDTLGLVLREVLASPAPVIQLRQPARPAAEAAAA